jgi:hypothetical protein
MVKYWIKKNLKRFSKLSGCGCGYGQIITTATGCTPLLLVVIGKEFILCRTANEGVGGINTRGVGCTTGCLGKFKRDGKFYYCQ